MNGFLVLLLLIITAALPAIVVFFWFKARKSPIALPWFLASLAAGFVSLLVAVLVQKLFPPPGAGGIWDVFFGVFIRIALVEELSRIAGLTLLLAVIKRYRDLDTPLCAALGLISGLGFAVMESAFYGLSGFNIILLRAVSAVPLHGACGVRVCVAFFTITKHPIKALLLFISAVLVHGAYNLLIVSPAFPSLMAILIAFTALFTSIKYFSKTASKDDIATFVPPQP